MPGRQATTRAQWPVVGPPATQRYCQHEHFAAAYAHPAQRATRCDQRMELDHRLDHRLGADPSSRSGCRATRDLPYDCHAAPSSQRPEPAALPREPRRRSRVETAAAWTQVVALPLAVAGVIYAGLAYSRQAEDAHQALAAIQLQQKSLAVQQRTILTLQNQIQTTH